MIITVPGISVVESCRFDSQVRQPPVERVARKPRRFAGVLAVSVHGPQQASRTRQVCGSTSASLAIRRYRAGRRRGGNPRVCVPCHRHGGRVR